MVQLTKRQAEILLGLIDFLDNMPICAEEIMDCGIDEWNELDDLLRGEK